MDIYADWCGPCKIAAPKFMKLSDEWPDTIFLKVNADDCEDIAEEYDLQAMPTFIFIKNRNVVYKLQGAKVDKLKEKIEALSVTN